MHALTNRGLAYLNDGDISRALADFDAALKRAPDASDLYSFRSIARRQAGDEAGAKADEAMIRAAAPRRPVVSPLRLMVPGWLA